MHKKISEKIKKISVKPKTCKGISLLEVIISIAALSIISGFILQMFIVSAELNQRAKDLDFLSLKAISTIEEIKSVGSGGEIFFYEYYDREYNLVKAVERGQGLEEGYVVYDAKFLIEVEVRNSAEGLGGNMYDIRASVYIISADSLDDGSTKEALVSFNTRKYFKH